MPNKTNNCSEKALKEAFDKIKKDIFLLGKEISDLRNDLIDVRSLVKYLDESINLLKTEQIEKNLPKRYDSSTDNQTHNQINSTHLVTSTHNSTVPHEVGGLKYPNLDSSIGNRGVSTDRQTNRQTDNSTHFYTENTIKPTDPTINQASEILENLDVLKKQLRLKFKTMTPREILVFSTIYQLEEQGHKDIDYNKLSSKLGLSQSSIRDYIQRISNKGIPIHKTKVNNKKIILNISPELKKIASLQTILHLREI